MKKIEDYLPFYIGQKVKMPGHTVEITHALLADEHAMKHWGKKPFLRPLIDMKESEAREYANCYAKNLIPNDIPASVKEHESGFVNVYVGNENSGMSLFPGGPHGDRPEAFRYLLSKGFDLFGLIEAGLALPANETTVNQK